MLSVKNNFNAVMRQINDAALSCGRNPEEITLIAVSKKKEIPVILEGINTGAAHLGENYIQEAVRKIDSIGKNRVCWHFIGHLQTKKAKSAVKYFEYIHTVDTIKLAREIQKQALKINKVQKILLQVNIGGEETKSGADIMDIHELAHKVMQLDNLSLKGLMCIPPYCADPELARPYFRKLAQIRDKIKEEFKNPAIMEHLSMGMSNDFKIAIEEGATMIRVGTSIFGRRE